MPSHTGMRGRKRSRRLSPSSAEPSGDCIEPAAQGPDLGCPTGPQGSCWIDTRVLIGFTFVIHSRKLCGNLDASGPVCWGIYLAHGGTSVQNWAYDPRRVASCSGGSTSMPIREYLSESGFE